MVTLVIALLLTSLKKFYCFSERNTPPCTNCVCNNLGFFRSVLVPTNDFSFVTFSKSNAFVLLGVAPKDTCALRGFIPLENLRAHLHTTIGSAVCKQTRALWGDPTPPSTSFVAKKKGTDYSVLLFSIFQVYASLSSRALQVDFADP